MFCVCCNLYSAFVVICALSLVQLVEIEIGESPLSSKARYKNNDIGSKY